MQLDRRVLTVASAVSLMTGVLAGILPAWQASRTSVFHAASARQHGSRGKAWLRAGLVVGQLAATQALLIAAGPADLDARVSRADQSRLRCRSCRRRDVLPARGDLHDPRADGRLSSRAHRRRRPASARHCGRPPHAPAVRLRRVSTRVPAGRSIGAGHGGLFSCQPWRQAALHMSIVEGRFFDDRDRREATGVAVMDDRFAKTYFAGSIRSAGESVSRDPPTGFRSSGSCGISPPGRSATPGDLKSINRSLQPRRISPRWWSGRQLSTR